MKRWALVLVVCSCAALTFFPHVEAAAQGAAAAAVVEEIQGAAFWRRRANAGRERLDPKKHVARRLYPGEQVRVTRGSMLRLRLGGDAFVVPPGVWFPIPRSVLPASNPFRRMLDAYADVGGVRRSSPLQVYSPAHNGAALPRPFVIRWVPTARGCTLSLLITDVGLRRRVWRQDGVDGSSGSLSSAGAEKELLAHRADFGQGPLELMVFDSCGDESHVSFSLLAAESEQALAQDLAFWGEDMNKLIAHLGRASVYTRYGLFSHAAEEYEAALTLAPDSHHLLERTIAAHRLTGNSSRAGTLRNRLKPPASIR